MLAKIGPSRPAVIVVLIMSVPAPVFVLVMYRIVALVLAVVRITSAGWIAGKISVPGRAASSDRITGTGGASGAVGITAGGKATVCEFPIPVRGTDFSRMTSRIPVAFVREDGHRKKENSDDVDELHLVCSFKGAVTKNGTALRVWVTRETGEEIRQLADEPGWGRKRM